MKLTMKVTTHLRTREMKELGRKFADQFAEQGGKLAAQYAKENVAPGRGPGPHPHITFHEDTGKLQSSIQYVVRKAGFLHYAAISTDVDYGLFLEKGWHTTSGRFVQYPWLDPAVARAMAEEIARAKILASWISSVPTNLDFGRAITSSMSVTE